MLRDSMNLVLGTAGHIDHGKTSLLKRLTGIDADRLKEEQDRGITIDIGFAPWLAPPYVIGFVDVPGHEKFVKNMLAGTGGIDGMLLVVAADEGIMPQTREHFEIAKLLEIPRGIVALNKIDLVEPDFAALVEEDIREMTRGSFLERAPVIPTSAATGQGIPELQSALRAMADEAGPRDCSGIPRLFIDRVFTMRGYGVVVTGTLLSGRFSRNDPVLVLPPGKIGRIRHIQVYGQECEEARAGQRVAFNLTGLDGEELDRGMVATRPGTATPTRMFNGDFRLLESYGKRMKNRSPVHVYHGAAELLGRLQFLGRDELEPGQSTPVQIRLETPAALWPGDHFVIRQYSPLVTMGGGIVLENHPERFRQRDQAGVLSRLDGIRGLDPVRLVRNGLRLGGVNGTTLNELQDRTGLSEDRLQEILDRELTAGTVLAIGSEKSRWADRARVEEAVSRARALLEEHFRRNMYSPGMRKQEWRSGLPDLSEDAFSFVVRRLREDGSIRDLDDRIALNGRRVEFDPATAAAMGSAVEALRRAGPEGLDWPALRGILFGVAREDPSLIDYLLQQRRLLRIAPDYFLSPEVFDGLADTMRGRMKKGESLEVGSFKEWFGLTRRRAIPLLEYMDRQGITMRVGDGRRLRGEPAADISIDLPGPVR